MGASELCVRRWHLCWGPHPRPRGQSQVLRNGAHLTGICQRKNLIPN